MDNTNRLVTPFITALTDEIVCSVEDAIGFEIARHDRVREVVIFKENRRLVKYEDEDGRELGLDDTVRAQAFSVVKKLRIIKGRNFHPARGISFEADLALVLAQVNGKDEPVLWQGANAFQAEKVFSYKLEDTTNGNESVSGYIKEGTTIDFSPVAIATRYFPNQVDKVQQRQLDLTTLEFNYKLIIENVCTFCLRRA